MIRSLLLGLLAFATLTAQTPASDVVPDAPPAVIAMFAARNASVSHFTFDVNARIALLTFPWIRFTLHGHGTYTRGGDYSVHFDNVPWFGKGFETMPMSALDVTTWPSIYHIEVAQQNGTETTLALHDVKKSPLTQASAQIDAVEGLRQILWQYNYGGHVKLTITPQSVDGFYFPGAEEAEIVMPQYRAMAWATFSNYQIVTDRSDSAQRSTGQPRR